MDQPLCNGEWHTVLVIKNLEDGMITIDNTIIRTNTTDPDLPSMTSVNIDSPLYAGGVPGSNMGDIVNQSSMNKILHVSPV